MKIFLYMKIVVMGLACLLLAGLLFWIVASYSRLIIGLMGLTFFRILFPQKMAAFKMKIDRALRKCFFNKV